MNNCVHGDPSSTTTALATPNANESRLTTSRDRMGLVNTRPESLLADKPPACFRGLCIHVLALIMVPALEPSAALDARGQQIKSVAYLPIVFKRIPWFVQLR